MNWIKIDQYDNGEALYKNVTTRLDRFSQLSRRRPRAGGWCLTKEIDRWLVDQGVEEYEFSWTRSDDDYWYVGIEDDRKAMLFKLVWGI